MQRAMLWRQPAATARGGLVVALGLTLLGWAAVPAAAPDFTGRFFRGTGDVEYLRLLELSRRVFAPDPEFQNLAMLYTPAWNGLIEGPTWDAWWVQNSYGPTYAVLPFLPEPFLTFLQNSQDLWFDQMGDGQRVGAPPPFNWVAPDGALCDCARPGWIVYKQGDGRIHLHDWGLEFTAAGLLMQAELLLIRRDPQAIARYLPKLERCARFIETRRDPTNNLFLAGPAANLLAPSFAGWKRPDGTYGQAYLAGLSVTYIAALDRLIELEKLAGRTEEAARWTERRDAARQGLARLTTDEGYFINSLDPDGTRHGVFGAPRHGYFEAPVNHDAIAFRVVDDAQARRIYAKIASIPGLRPHGFILPNYPSYDDMYEEPKGLWAYGTWVNGGHWSTCEARMMLGYYRLGAFEDARRSMRQWLTFAERFRLDNPLVRFGSDVYQPGEPINITYDAFGPPAAFIRGLFEYLYRADGLTLRPHIPPGLTRLEQLFPVRFGTKRLYLATVGSGPIRAVSLNGQPWRKFDAKSVFLPYAETPERAAIEIALGDAKLQGFEGPAEQSHSPPPVPPNDEAWLQLKKAILTTNALPFRIGADSNGENRFRGDIAQARLFSRALTSNEIAALARGQPGALLADPALVGNWSFDSRHGRPTAPWIDLPGGRPLTRPPGTLSPASGGEGWGEGAQVTQSADQGAFPSAGPVPLPARIVGRVEPVDAPEGRAVRLTGDGFLEVAPHPALNLTQACTLEAWICPAAFRHGGSRILDKSQAGTSNGYLLDTWPDKGLRLIAQVGTLQHPVNLVTGQWVHVAGTVAPDGTLTLYLNGQVVAQRLGGQMPDIPSLLAEAERLQRFHRLLAQHGWADSYEAAHARLALECLATAHTRYRLLRANQLKPLPNPVSQMAADEAYLDTVRKLIRGLVQRLVAYEKSTEPRQQQLFALWQRAAAADR